MLTCKTNPFATIRHLTPQSDLSVFNDLAVFILNLQQMGQGEALESWRKHVKKSAKVRG